MNLADGSEMSVIFRLAECRYFVSISSPEFPDLTLPMKAAPTATPSFPNVLPQACIKREKKVTLIVEKTLPPFFFVSAGVCFAHRSQEISWYPVTQCTAKDESFMKRLEVRAGAPNSTRALEMM